MSRCSWPPRFYNFPDSLIITPHDQLPLSAAATISTLVRSTPGSLSPFITSSLQPVKQLLTILERCGAASAKLARCHVRFGSKADIDCRPLTSALPPKVAASAMPILGPSPRGALLACSLRRGLDRVRRQLVEGLDDQRRQSQCVGLGHRDPSRSCLDRMDHRARLAGPIRPAGAPCGRRGGGRRRCGPPAPDRAKSPSPHPKSLT
jgi:hypothetical protein